LTNVPSTFPPSAHGHTIADVIGLQTALDGKQASGSYATLVGGKVPESQLPPIVTTWEGLTGKPSTFPPSTHSHVIADVTGLQTAIDGKAASSHTHTISNVTGLQTALDAKATPADVTTAVASVVNAAPASLDTLKELADALGNDANFASTVTNAIAGKAAAVHTHVIGDVTGLQTALDGKQASGSYAASVHTHGISDVTGLQTALDGKQAAGSYAAATHGHSISDVTGLQTALDGKSGVSHTHSASQVTSGQFDVARIPSLPASQIGSGTLDAARLPTATLTQAQNAVSTAVSNPLRVRDQMAKWKLVNLSENQRDITVSGSTGSVSLESLILNANNGFATANATAIYRGWGFETVQYYNASGQGATSAATNWSWTRPLAFAFRVAIGGFFATTSTGRVQFGKKLVNSLGTLDQQGIGIEIRGNTLNTSGRLWLLAHNGTTLTSTDTGLNLNCSPWYDIVLTSDGAGNVTALVNDVAYTTTGGPTTDLLNAASGSGISIEATNGNTANASTALRTSRHFWVTAQ
jgi:hypothetical protein